MKKKNLSNWLTFGLIVLVIISGLAAVSYWKGWFDKSEPNTAKLQDLRGVVHLYRDGLCMNAENDMVLRAGDRLVLQSGAGVTIGLGEDQLMLLQQADLTLVDPAVQSFHAKISSGQVLAHCQQAVTLEASGKTFRFQETTALLLADQKTIGVLRGQVGKATAGQTHFYDRDEYGTLAVTDLSEDTVALLQSLPQASVCFSQEELQQIAQQKQQQMQTLVDATTPAETTQNPTQEEPQPPQTQTCTVAIYCNTILNNMDTLEPGKAEFVPASGVILYPVSVQFTPGQTAFDVLKQVCDSTGIQLEYSWTPLYNSYYVEGIHHLYEFDCGYESGWMYKVNGSYPNYGSSSYKLQDGDAIVWAYTCSGLGSDLG